ncbi:MAG: NrtA/SsuA/CpmA family ABC transporter substrate-binding protein [Tyzzerella sp.]|nr:NrtA/SsuA/CpmA family ABC transporter substrate-binding protein [Tyzzerella sp.]
MKKKIMSLIMVACLLTGAVVGCGQNKQEKLPEKLTFTYVTAPLNIPSIVEREERIFAEEFEDDGIKVEYAELTSGADQTQALASGDVQVLYGVGASSVILSAANGADIKVLNMYSRSPKAFCLYAKGDTIKSAEDLRGKTIAGPAGTNLHELLVAFLAKADMTIKDVNYVNMPIPDAKVALDGGSIDVALLAGATAYQAEQQGYHKVADGEGLIDAIIVVAVTNEFYKKYPELIDELMDAQEEIDEFIKQNENEAFAMTAKALDLDVEAVKEMYRYYDFSTKITSSDKNGFQRTADFMYENGMIEKKLDIDILF